jgi:tRNA-modifying protein YgfZ
MNGYEALRAYAGWIDLSARGKLRLTGEDRARLLHAMSTNQIKDLPPESGVYAFFLNDKGHIQADAYIYNLGESMFLDTEPETGPLLYDHLDRYIIADDVTLEDETSQWVAIGLEGSKSEIIAGELKIPMPRLPNGLLPFSNGFVTRTAFTGPVGLRIFLPVADKADFIARLATAGVAPVTAEEARTVRIENGIPRYGEDISDRYLVQETQALHGVHFSKGCYLGQEIVERVRSRGQVHRLLAALRLETSVPPASGTKLLSAGQLAGEITSAAYSPALGKVVALGYVRGELLQTKAEMTVTGNEPPIRGWIA